MESRKARIAENEVLFREMNAHMAAWEERRDAPTERHLFFCECGDRRCHERVRLTVAEYGAIRRDPMHFAVLREHVIPDTERMVAQRDGYVVVEKHEDVRGIVDTTDLHESDS